MELPPARTIPAATPRPGGATRRSPPWSRAMLSRWASGASCGCPEGLERIHPKNWIRLKFPAWSFKPILQPCVWCPGWPVSSPGLCGQVAPSSLGQDNRIIFYGGPPSHRRKPVSSLRRWIPASAGRTNLTTVAPITCGVAIGLSGFAKMPSPYP